MADIKHKTRGTPDRRHMWLTCHLPHDVHDTRYTWHKKHRTQKVDLYHKTQTKKSLYWASAKEKWINLVKYSFQSRTSGNLLKSKSHPNHRSFQIQIAAPANGSLPGQILNLDWLEFHSPRPFDPYYTLSLHKVRGFHTEYCRFPLDVKVLTYGLTYLATDTFPQFSLIEA